MPNHKGTRVTLSLVQREDIRRRYGDGESVDDIASIYGCAKTTVWFHTKGMFSARTQIAYDESMARMSGVSTEDRHWIAGIIDGESWIGIGRNGSYNGPRVSVSSTDEIMAPSLHHMLGGSLCRKLRHHSVKQRDTWCWDMFALPTVRAFCESFGPLLRVKGAQASSLAAYCKSRMDDRTKSYTEPEQAFVAALTLLNKRGRQ